MATPVLMPRRGQSVESCVITKWHKQVNDRVCAGEILFTYETDKSVFDEEAPADGILLARFFEEGDDVPCMVNVCVIGEKGERFEGFMSSLKQTKNNIGILHCGTHIVQQPGVFDTENIRISPRAKALAQKLGIDYHNAVPTGAGGRITEKDIEEAALRQNSNNILEYEDIPLSNIRRIISENMKRSLSEAAQLTHHTSFDASSVQSAYEKLKNSGAPVTENDIIVYVMTRLLTKHPDLNAHMMGGYLRRFKHVHMGIAMDTERGLVVPTIFNADEKSLYEISDEIKRLAAMCRSGAVEPDILKGATFTVSNLSALGIESFTPIINPPQTGILGICAQTLRAKKLEDGTIGYYPAMGLSLTYDHRILDGAPVSLFLRELVLMLEDFNISGIA